MTLEQPSFLRRPARSRGNALDVLASLVPGVFALRPAVLAPWLLMCVQLRCGTSTWTGTRHQEANAARWNTLGPLLALEHPELRGDVVLGPRPLTCWPVALQWAVRRGLVRAPRESTHDLG